MTERVLGPAGSPRRRRTWLLPLAAALVVGLFYIAGAQAVHDAGVFELDANAVSAAGTGQPNDWDDIFATAPNCPGTTVCRFTHEVANATIFTGGGSKDDLDTTSWQHKNGSSPPKDDMLDAFAARYSVPTYDPDGATGPLPPGSDIVYFGADRFANNGDAALGFWFFQANITAQPPVGNADGTFGPGQHLDGDLLIISEFTNGGSNVRIAAYQWNGPGGTIAGQGAINGTLDELFPLTSQDCATVGGNDPMCGSVNGVTESSPWPFTDTTGSTSFRDGEFFEGGVNLTFLGLEDECFTSFLAETRSSTSIDATLKDFVIGQFAPCVAQLSTAPSGVAAGGTVLPGVPVSDVATVLGQGLSNPPTPTGNVTFFICGPIASGTCNPPAGTQVGSAVALASSAPPQGEAQATSAPVNTAAVPLAPGRYCFRASWPGDTNYPGALLHSGTGDSECFNVAKINTQTVTTPVDGSGVEDHEIQVGGTIFDKAVVTGTAAGGDPTGDVTFFLCTPAQLTPANTGVCAAGSGTQHGAVKPLVSDGNPATFTSSALSDVFTATAVGKYCFRATYGGSTVYNPSSDNGNPNECFTVGDTTSITSLQDWLPNDTATVASGGGSTPISGTLSFTLHSGGTCTGAVLKAAETFTLTNATSLADRTKSTTNTSVKVTADATVSWNVVFTPAAGSGLTGSTHCEQTTLDLTN